MIFKQLSEQLNSLSNLLNKLTDQQYIHKIEHLANASIGGHTRHIIELVQCAMNGYYTGEVDYVNRKRNLDLQTDKHLAATELQVLANNIRLADKRLRITVDEIEGYEPQEVYTTYYREIVYNAEHTIHHLALIRVALIEMKLELVDKNFGLAYSTIKFQKTLVTA